MANRETSAAPTGSDVRAGYEALDTVYRLAIGERRAEAFARAALRVVRRRFGASSTRLVEAVAGQWLTLAEVGDDVSPPSDLLAAVIDTLAPQSAGNWLAVPLSGAKTESRVVALQSDATVDTDALVDLAHALGEGQRAVAARENDDRRTAQLERLVDVSREWYRIFEIEPLLNAMAAAATELLDAERASIFLWDRANHILVGRPALGVEGGELRIPDDAGIVGQVLQTGQPRRASESTKAAKSEESGIDHDVDKQTGFSTESLVCVPLLGRDAELLGAFEVLNKHHGEFSDADEAMLTELASHAAVALENAQQRDHLLRARRHVTEEAAQGVRLIGECPAIVALRSTVARVADTDLAVLILGENGTGKEVVSQLVHYLSARREEPFVAVNCAALTETLLESELFGHEKGAFTDARDTHIGKFELASDGTLFLDEIGDLSLGGQAKLLRVLEDKVVVRVGGSTPISINTRVIAATNQDLAKMVAQRRFREDLFYRLNVVALELPPLRERGDDVLLLAEYFAQQFAAAAHRPRLKLTESARKRLRSHTWKGNIRELRNVIERVAYLSTSERIDADDLGFMLPAGDDNWGDFAPDATLADATTQFQRHFIEKSVERSGGNMTDVARRLGLHRSNLYRKMKQLGMNAPE
ncbi:MAG: sigma-54-dependent Fis family transcriptional regulator [Pirellulales bacterium]